MTWQYLAGFFDGEGSVVTKRDGTISFDISISQTQLRVLEDIREFLVTRGMKVYIYDRKKYVCFGRKQQWSLRLNERRSVELFLTGILPYVVVKRVFVQDAVRFLHLYPPIIRFVAREKMQRYHRQRQGLRDLKEKYL